MGACPGEMATKHEVCLERNENNAYISIRCLGDNTTALTFKFSKQRDNKVTRFTKKEVRIYSVFP